jgi:hypothetical protein
MATINNAIVTTLGTEVQVRKSEYRGNPQWVPVDLTGLTIGDTVVFTDILPANTKAVSLLIRPLSTNTGGTLDIGFTGDADGIRVDADVSAEVVLSLDNVDVSGKQIIGTVETAVPTSGFAGSLLIVTDE